MTEWICTSVNEWVDGCNRAKCEIFCVLFWNGVLTFHFFPCWSASGSFFIPSNQRIDDNIPNEYQHVKLLYICVMKSVIKLWEVNAFIVNLNLFHHIYMTLIVPFTKSMFAAIVYILLSVTLIMITQKSQNYHSHMTIDHEAILQLITDYSYNNILFFVFLFVCRSLCMFLCRRHVWFEGVFLEIECLKEFPLTRYPELFHKSAHGHSVLQINLSPWTLYMMTPPTSTPPYTWPPDCLFEPVRHLVWSRLRP